MPQTAATEPQTEEHHARPARLHTSRQVGQRSRRRSDCGAGRYRSSAHQAAQPPQRLEVLFSFDLDVDIGQLTRGRGLMIDDDDRSVATSTRNEFADRVD